MWKGEEMPRPRRRTEHLGFQATLEESRAFKDYLRQRGLSASEYFRQMVVQTIQQAAQDGPVQRDPDAA
jgi:hypothetical protein